MTTQPISGAASAAAQRAALAMRNSREFCQLLAQCREFKVPGWWDGSAYRCHPVGLIVGAFKFTNHWHVDQLCTIEITDGSGWDRNVCQDSFAHSSPHPKPVGGSAVQVWRCGDWSAAEFAESLTSTVLEILTAAAEHIERAIAKRAEAEATRAEEARARTAAITAAALKNAARSAA